MHPVETYVRELRQNRAAGVAETSHYAALSALLNAAGDQLRPRVRCVLHPRGRGAGLPDAGLFTTDQLPRAEGASLAGVLPERGVVEAKATSADVRKVVETEQVGRYLEHYGQVLITSFRDWLLVERGLDGHPITSERFRMAETEAEFWAKADDPRALAEELGDRLLEYLRRVMLRQSCITEPRDLAWLLAAYARDARYRVERGGDLPALRAVREELEGALGVTFRGDHGEHFFRSTLVQTLFYGVFSAWTLWSRNPSGTHFDWKTSAWHLRVPVIGALFSQIATPERLGPLKLVEVLDWAGDALNRVARDEFFARFEEQHAVQYFYEPFLEAFDPLLRKDLGVWYTPPEVVKYMVARVDTLLKQEMKIPLGLADRRVLVLDPCCGTGAFLVGVLERIAENLNDSDEGALIGVELRKAAAERVFGFELLPAPFVVAHLQLGLLLGRMEAPENEGASTQRVGVFLTNALTGWDTADNEKDQLLIPELQAEREAAHVIKHDRRILVVIGNPPYNGFPGVAIGEERDLVEAYRETTAAPKPSGHGLNERYVRFFRAAERKIVELTGQGIVCFVSNYSWLDGLSHPGMRERFLDAFDKIWIDSLNGDKYRTGKQTPSGDPDPSVFSTDLNREGIQVGAAVATLVRLESHAPATSIEYREFWGRNKRRELLEVGPPYITFRPVLALGLSFNPGSIGARYFEWPLLSELFMESFSGVQTKRDEVVTDIDREALIERMTVYFDRARNDDEVSKMIPRSMEPANRFDPVKTRRYLVNRGFLADHVVRYYYRPFDLRWVYWEPETRLLGEKSPEYFPNSTAGNMFLFTTGRTRKMEAEPPILTSVLVDLNAMDSGARGFPLYLAPRPGLALGDSTPGWRTNLTPAAIAYLVEANAKHEDLFNHILAILHSTAYRAENAGALRQDWPRIPLPIDAVHLHASAALGRQVAALLDLETPVSHVTAGVLRPELRVLGSIARLGGGQLEEADFALTARWGHSGKGGAVMPGRGRTAERPYTDMERTAIEAGVIEQGLDPAEAVALLGETCVDVHLNERAYWRCVPTCVWEYTLGGYQVIKKWLSYREQPLLGRPLTLDEVREVTGIIRRIAAILLLEPALDGVYAAVKGATYPWQAPAATAADVAGASTGPTAANQPAQPGPPPEHTHGQTLF